MQFESIAFLGCNVISFKTERHGIPFLKSGLGKILNLGDAVLRELTKQKQHPFLFSIKIAGFDETVKGLFKAAEKIF